MVNFVLLNKSVPSGIGTPKGLHLRTDLLSFNLNGI